MITRKTAYDTLTKYKQCELLPLAKEHGVTIVAKSGKINKGWKGQTLELLAGLKNNNKKAPNGLGWELKGVPYSLKNEIWQPKETMAITGLNPEDLDKNDFLKSHLWEKIKSLIFCPVSWIGTNNTNSILLDVKTFDCLEEEDLIIGIKSDYDLIRNKLRTQGFKSLTSKDGIYIQTRTKGTGHGSKSRAFYARKPFLVRICPPWKG